MVFNRNNKNSKPVRRRFEFVSAEERPVFEAVLGDRAKTVVSVLTPTKALYRIIGDMQNCLAGLSDPDVDAEEAISRVYGAAAELISNNVEGKTFEGAELENKYGVTPDYLIRFFNAYTAFLDEVISSKN